MNLSQYQTLIFDCDGVILNSNHIKTQAFYNVAKVYGYDAAEALRTYHISNGGISRYEKFKYFLQNILEKPIKTEELNELLTNFSKEVKKSLLTCEVTSNIKELRSKTKNSKWLIVSGGDQKELREIFAQRKLDIYFDGGIFGSPDDKDNILKTEKLNKNITGKTLFLGDSIYDYEASKRACIDFAFFTKWTEVKDWEDKFSTNAFLDLSELVQL